MSLFLFARSLFVDQGLLFESHLFWLSMGHAWSIGNWFQKASCRANSSCLHPQKCYARRWHHGKWQKAYSPYQLVQDFGWTGPIVSSSKSKPNPSPCEVANQMANNYSSFVKNQHWFMMSWMFPKIGVPQNGWFIMEQPMNKWMIWGVFHPIFLETATQLGINQSSLTNIGWSGLTSRALGLLTLPHDPGTSPQNPRLETAASEKWRRKWVGKPPTSISLEEFCSWKTSNEMVQGNLL